MNKAFTLASAAAGLLLAGCAAPESGRVYTNANGTRVYDLKAQPQTALAGDRPLMPGATSTHEMTTGQFTGEERSHDLIGQRPLPPASDAREMARSSAPATGLFPGTGDSVQSYPGNQVPGTTEMDLTSAPNPPATAFSASADLDQTSAKRNAVGSPPGPETGNANLLTNNASVPQNREPNHSLRDAPTGVDAASRSAQSKELPQQIRAALARETPSSPVRLTPNQIQSLQIEAVNGNVTLHGTVANQTEKSVIGNKVERVPGVRSVRNELKVISQGR